MTTAIAHATKTNSVRHSSVRKSGLGAMRTRSAVRVVEEDRRFKRPRRRNGAPYWTLTALQAVGVELIARDGELADGAMTELIVGSVHPVALGVGPDTWPGRTAAACSFSPGPRAGSYLLSEVPSCYRSATTSRP